MSRLFGSAAALLVVIAAAAASVSAAAPPTPGDWKELVTLDCNGGVHWGNSQPLWRAGLDASVVRQLWDFAVTRIQSRVKCHCPSLTDLQVQTHFNGSFAAVLQWFGMTKTNPTSGLPNCQANAATRFTNDVASVGDSFSVNLPATCSYESWAAGEPCLVQMPMPGLSGTTFQMAFDHCPLASGGESNIPYVSVTCKGTACEDFMVPCNNNNDCSNNQQCSPLVGPQDTTSVLNWLRTALPKANLWIQGLFPGPDSGDDGASCTASTGDSINDQTFTSWVLNKLMGIVTPYTKLGALSLPVTSLQFCGAGTWHSNSFINVLGQGCTLTYNQAYDLTQYDCQLQTWDGTLQDGSSALSTARKNGEGFIPFATPGMTGLRTTSPNVADGDPVNLFTLPCGDGTDAPNDQLGILLNSPGVAVKAALPVVHAVQSAVVQVAATMADCRNGGQPLASDQLDIRFNPGWATVLNAAVDHTPAHPFVPPESALADPYTAAYKYFDPFNAYQSWPNPIVHLPDTCTLNSWLTTGSCGFQYTGLQSLLNRDVTIRFGAYACPATPHTFGAHAECVGAGCGDVVQPYMTSYCRQDSDCPTGRMCQQFPNLGRANYIADTFWNVFGDGSVFYISLQPPQNNYNYFSNMNAAQQQATINQLYIDVINATNQYGAWVWGSYWQTVDISSVDTLNSYSYWSTYPSINMYVKPQANTVNIFGSAVQYSTQFLASMPVGQYVSYISPSWYMFPQYVKCPSNGAWVLDSSECTPPDTCDTEPSLEADLLNFILQATGQPAPNPPIDPTAHFHGYCATVFNNVTSSSLNAWAGTQWGFDETRANPKVIVLPAVSAWSPPVPPAPQPPTPGGGGSGLSDSAKAGVVTASVLGGALAIGAIFYCCIRKKPGGNGAGIESQNAPLAANADRAV